MSQISCLRISTFLELETFTTPSTSNKMTLCTSCKVFWTTTRMQSKIQCAEDKTKTYLEMMISASSSPWASKAMILNPLLTVAWLERRKILKIIKGSRSSSWPQMQLSWQRTPKRVRLSGFRHKRYEMILRMTLISSTINQKRLVLTRRPMLRCRNHFKILIWDHQATRMKCLTISWLICLPTTSN